MQDSRDVRHSHHDSQHACRRSCRRHRWIFPIAGLISLAWFLVRVIPKPSRAAYPCQRMAAPLAGSFVLWIVGVIASAALWRKSLRTLATSRVALASAGLLVAAAIFAGAFMTLPPEPALADDPEPNAPVGTAKGINPGRVVWIYDPTATNWSGPGDGHWWEPNHTDAAVVDRMMSRSVRALTGASSDAAAWKALFRHFSRTHGNGDAGYKPGQKIAIKVNLVGAIIGKSCAVDENTYALVKNMDYMNTSPQVMHALLRQLVHEAGVKQADISIGDPLSRFPGQYFDMLHKDFPEVRYLDHDAGCAGQPRTKAAPSSVPLYWSSRPEGTAQDYVPQTYAEATYFINLANLKSHASAGVTLCAKNHFGSLIRKPPEKGYMDMHASLPHEVPGYGKYRNLVDLTGHAHIGGKALVYFIDGLYSGVHPVETSPKKWKLAPFNDDWSSSLLASQDPVAIDSVAYDFLRAEWSDYPRMAGADDYLHEAALADNPPSGTFYDPDHATATKRLASLGVHEHWDNPGSRQYSRNLFFGKGIELVSLTREDAPQTARTVARQAAASGGAAGKGSGVRRADTVHNAEGLE